MSDRNRSYVAALGGLTLAIALAVSVGAQQPSDPNGSEVQQATAQDAASSATPQKAAPYKPGCDAPASREDAEFCEQKQANRIALFSALIGAIGFGALVVTIYYTRKATIAAQEAALAAHAAVDETRNTAKTELRAYMSAQAGRLEFQDTTKNWHFALYPVARNAGQTPAYRVRFVSTIKVLPYPLPETYDFTLADQGGSLMTVAAGETFEMGKRLEYPLNDKALTDVISGNKRLYTYGHLTYEDVWGEKHRTEFCYHIEFVMPAPVWIFQIRNNHAD